MIYFVIRHIYHIETTFFPKPPAKMAEMIELGNENSWSDRIRKRAERTKIVSTCLSNDWCSLRTN